VVRPDLQTHAQLISNNFQSIATQLSASEAGDLFRSTVAFPTPKFPGAQHQNILETLLRTKLEPGIDDWVKEGESITGQQRKPSTQRLSDNDRHELWQWAPGAANAAARKQTWGADYTRAEQQAGVDSVVTGLRRQLVEPPEDEEEEGPDDEEEEYEGSDEDDEGEDAMDVEQQKPKDTKSAIGSQTTRPATDQMPLSSVLKFMTTGR
jgi:mediator of RNA polymerase II transcription subunit 8, fungi type